MRKFTKIRVLLNKRSKFLWSVLFVIIAVATIWAVISQSRAFSAPSFVSYIAGMSKIRLIAAIISMLGFIIFEGEAIVTVCRAFGYSVKHRNGFLYSASDIYFSAITPSASGGQPACAYFMMKDRIPGSVATVALLVNVTMYTISIFIVGLIAALIQPQIFLSFGFVSQILIILGCLVQGLFAAFFILLLTKGELLHKICHGLLHFFCKIKVLKCESKKQNKLAQYIKEYTMYAGMIKDHKKTMAKVLIFNILQRISVISVSLFVFLASGGEIAKSAQIWAIQCYTVIGSNCVPIPGAMGVSDYIMLDGFGKMMSYQNAVNLELLSRSLSFYVCVILCGIATLIKYWMQRKKRNNL